VLSTASAVVPVVLRDALLPIFLRRQGDRAVAWLHGHHIDWDAPVPVAGAGARR
jgi:FAD-dependent urate hydroxylase